MADSNRHNPDRSESLPGSWDPLLAEALGHAPGTPTSGDGPGDGPGDAPADDPTPTNGAERAHEDEILEALRDLEACDDAQLLQDASLRAHVVDVAAAGIDAEVELPARIRDAALAAFDESLSPVTPIRAARGVRTQPLRAAAFRPTPFLRTGLAAAAMILVALGAVVFLGTGEDAEAGLQLNSLARVDLSSAVRMSTVEPRYFAKLGHVFTPGEDELLSLGFGSDALLVVGGGDAVRVSHSALLGAAALRLESGEARLATADRPIRLELGTAGLLVLEEGAAHAAFDAAGSTLPAVALAEGSIARFHRASGGDPVVLTGPARVLLAPEGPQKHGTPARTLFRDLEFFGGPLPRVTQVRTVSPRLWTIAVGPARRGRSDIRIENRVLAEGAQDERAVRLTWRAPKILADATSLRVALRAPSGTKVAVAGLGAAVVNGRHDDDPQGSSASEPGVATVEIPLPADWYERVEAHTLTLVLEVPTGTRAWFDGASLVLGATNEDAIARLRGRVASSGRDRFEAGSRGGSRGDG